MYEVRSAGLGFTLLPEGANLKSVWVTNGPVYATLNGGGVAF
jgi:hypothetical protein